MAINIPIISKFDDKGVKGAEGAFKGLGKSLAGFAGIAAGAFAAIGIGSFVKESITAASDLDESFNAINKSYGAFAKDVTALGDGVASRLGLSQVDFNAAAVRFSAFAEKIAGEGGSVAGVVDSLTTRAADFASVFNIEVSEALQVFQSGLSGEAEPLKRFGINLLDSEVKAYAYANGIAEVGAQLTENEKVQARYGLLLESTSKTAGDFADTSDGLANSQRILSATMEDLRAKVGAGLAPVVATLTAALVPLAEAIFPKIAEVIDTTVGPALQKMADYFSELVLIGTTLGGDNVLSKVFNDIKDAVTGFLEGGGLSSAVESLSAFRLQLFSAIVEALPAIIEGIAEMLPMVIQALADLFPIIVNSIVDFIPMMLDAAIIVFNSLVDALIIVIPVLITTLVALIPQILTTLLEALPEILDAGMEFFMSLVDALIEIIPELLDAVIQMIPEVIDTLLEALPEIIDAGVELFLGLVDGLVEMIPELLTAIIEMIPDITNQLIEALPDLIEAGFELFFGIVDGLLQALPEIITAVIDMIPEIVDALMDNLPKLIDAGIEIVKGLAKGIVDNAPRLLGNAINSLGNTLVGGVKSFLGIASPSKVFAGIGGDVVAGLEKGLGDGAKVVAGAAVDLSHNLTVSGADAFSNVVPSASQGPMAASAMASVPTSNVINLTVNAGMGADGSRIGQQIVDEILKYERSSGKVFARA